MKTFTITTPNKKQDSNGKYKNFLLNRLLTSYPELVIDGIDTEETPYSYQYIGPNTKIRFGSDHHSPCDVAKYKTCKYCPFAKEENYDFATEFELALKRLDMYAKTKRDYKPLYDFLLEDGTPVREYQNFIQVGYKLIPKNNIRGYYANLPKKEQTVVNNFIIMVNNSTEINAELNAEINL